MSPGDRANPSVKAIGKILVEQGIVTRDQTEALARRPEGGRLASRVLEAGLADASTLLRGLSEQQGVPGIDISKLVISLDNLDLVPREVARRHMVLPVLVKGDRIFLAMADPHDRRLIDELEFVSGKHVYPHVAIEAQLQAAIEECYELRDRGERFFYGPRSGQKPQAPIHQEQDENTEAVVEDRHSQAPLPSQLSEPEDVETDFSSLLEEVEPSPAPPRRGPPPPPPAAQATSRPRKRVLVVDDEADIRQLLVRVLKEKGYETVEAAGGLAALKEVQTHPPDMIILDAMLPEVHGFDICKRIKSSEKYGHIPVIMVSAIYRGWRYAEDLKESYGVDAFLEKPFRLAEIIDAVESLLAKQERPAEQDPEAMSEEARGLLDQSAEIYREGDIDRAIELLRQGIAIDPLAYRLHYHLALLYAKKEQPYDAIQELESTLELATDFFPALKNLAILYQRTGFTRKAREVWERALGASPDDKTREGIKAHLMSLL